MQKHLLLALCMASAAASTTLSAADFTPPCEIPCSTQEEFDTWLVEDANADTSDNTWFFNSTENAADYTYDANFAADDWLFSSALNLEGGKTYSIKGNFKTRSMSEKLAICIGGERNSAVMTTVIYKNESFKTTSYSYYGGTFTPEEDGIYYIGIHCYSNRNTYNIWFNNLKVEVILPYPAAATITSINADPNGLLEANVNWTMPSKNNLGGTLTSVTGAKIYRGDSRFWSPDESSYIGTFEGGTPGGECTWTDKTLTKPGKYYYAVIPFNENGDSPSSASIVQSDWIGMDTGVGTIPSVTAALQEGSETKITVTWETPKGTNGGPVDLTNLKYIVTRVGGKSTSSVTIADNIEGNTVDDEVNTLDQYTYTVTTIYNGESASSGKASNALVAGGALNLPYSEDFSGGSADKVLALWKRFYQSPGTRDWSVSSSQLNYWGSTTADAWAVTPPIILEAGKPYELYFKAKVSKTASPKCLYVYIGTEPTAENLLNTQLFYEKISLTEYKDKKINISVPANGRYYIAFRCYGPSDSQDLYVDDLSLKETVFTPAPVTNFTATAAEKGALAATLSWTNPTTTNAGTDLSEITKIEVLRGNDVVATLKEGLTLGAVATYTDNTISDAGKYTYTIKPYLAENAGEGESITSGWIGPDTPKAPVSVSVAVTDDGRVVTFEAAAEGENGGYVDADALRYAISRNGETIDSDVAESPYTDTATGLALGKYTYGVKTVWGELASAETMANAVVFGEALELPYEANFKSDGDLDFWTTTGDGASWEKNPGSWSGSIHSRYAADNAWAFTPPLKLVHSNLKLTYKDEKYYTSGAAQPLEVYISRSTDHTNADHHTLIDSRDVSNTSEAEHTVDFTVRHPGTYYVAYRIPTNESRIDLKSTKLEATTILTGVEDVTAEGDGMLMYSRTFDFIQAPEGVEVSVYNAAGVLVLRAEAVDGHVDTSALASGLYVAAATASGENLTLKFAK